MMDYSETIEQLRTELDNLATLATVEPLDGDGMDEAEQVEALTHYAKLRTTRLRELTGFLELATVLELMDGPNT